MSRLIEKKKRKALLHYGAASVLWECLTDVEAVDWLYNVDARISTIRRLSEIMTTFDQERSVFDFLADRWLRK